MSKKTILFIFVVIGIFYLSWLPDPTLRNETYFPKWLLDWSNHYYNLRTAIPFLAVGFLLAANKQQNISKEINNNNNFIQIIGIATIIVCIAEIGQFLITERNPDLMDVFYGILGSMIGAYSFNLFKRLKDAK
jgi:glycopeptide antibiotics resistance protein